MIRARVDAVMSILLSCRSLTKSYGPRPLFTDVALGVSDGERLGLIGPNGSGKSTLLKILAGVETPDQGEVTRRKGVRVGYAPQAGIHLGPQGDAVAWKCEAQLTCRLDVGIKQAQAAQCRVLNRIFHRWSQTDIKIGAAGGHGLEGFLGAAYG